SASVSASSSSEIFFFFQAEDGIRDGHVTGVQTCALPISLRPPLTRAQRARAAAAILARVAADMVRRRRRLPPPVFAPALLLARPPPTKPANRRSRESIWRRKETASSNCLSDKSITTFLAVCQLC